MACCKLTSHIQHQRTKHGTFELINSVIAPGQLLLLNAAAARIAPAVGHYIPADGAVAVVYYHCWYCCYNILVMVWLQFCCCCWPSVVAPVTCCSCCCCCGTIGRCDSPLKCMGLHRCNRNSTQGLLCNYHWRSYKCPCTELRPNVLPVH